MSFSFAWNDDFHYPEYANVTYEIFCALVNSAGIFLAPQYSIDATGTLHSSLEKNPQQYLAKLREV